MPYNFYENAGITVSDTTFWVPNGDQYPIRNITSVQVRKKENTWALIIGSLLLIYGAFHLIGFASDIDKASVNASFGIALLTYWWLTRKLVLLIGAGGKQQVAISFNKREEEKHAILTDVANALNKSISNLQKT